MHTGSIGGAITMNSGCYGFNISDILLSILVIDEKGREIEIRKYKFYYRGTDIPENYLILSATLKGEISSKEKIKNKQEEFIKKKKEYSLVKLKLGVALLKIAITRKHGS